jgi:phospholipase/carboxylesterase
MSVVKTWPASLPISRRRFLAAAGGLTSAGCATSGSGSSRADPAHIEVAPGPPKLALGPGEHRLGLDDERDGAIYVPRVHQPGRPSPLAVMLHGAGGNGGRMRFSFALADEFGMTVLAPDSRGGTWDFVRGGFGPDVAFIGAALQHVFDRVAVDPKHLAIGGFSDGASYALSLGLANGRLFTHVLAFSPGFIVRTRVRGRPRIFVSHGAADRVLPINQTSRRIVADLKEYGYSVRYREFDGPHTVPPDLARDAFAWFTH